MSRLSRLSVAGFVHHALLRGHNRQPIVLDDEDRLRLLHALAAQAQGCGVGLHAWVLMDNHLHLLLTPETADSLPRMMQGVGRAYVRHFNRRHERSGTLWEGRYRSAVLEPARYLLDAMAYLDLNPVRAALVAEPAHYPWSSHAHWAGLGASRVPLVAHPLYWALGNTPFAREQAYAAHVRAGLSADTLAALRGAVHGGWALGGADFLAELQAQTPRRVTRGRAGRPRRTPLQAAEDSDKKRG